MSKKPTNLRVPVTNGLKDIYAMDMHLPYQAACEERFSVTAFARMAVAISVVRTALVQKNTQIPDAVEILDAAIVTLTTIRARGDATDVWEIKEEERPSVLAGIEVAEDCIGVLDVALLEQTAAMLMGQMSGEQPG
ncbi:MAG: hypothetical protein KJ850_09130 [Gammaproteobacteria bacterium]|nr:hypothetical protein [Gammaproteobacteria bacterium]MBU1625194.1 hypothetical protein [Gammaproteobacteria bacterium]MBU1981454.1 hypothetical protein [Gammaproteobacteria bacterium]